MKFLIKFMFFIAFIFFLISANNGNAVKSVDDQSPSVAEHAETSFPMKASAYQR